MDDYISRETAVNVIRQETARAPRTRRWAIDMVKHVPAADVEPVVRCENCKNAYQNQFGEISGTVVCTLLKNQCGWPIVRKENDYCSYGEPIKCGDRHGRWIEWCEQFYGREMSKKLKLGAFCSVCRSYSAEKAEECPNCGAKMDGGTGT